MASRARLTKKAFEKALEAFRVGGHEKAQGLLLQVLAADPRHAGAHYVLGLVALAAARHAEAYQDFARASELEPQNAAMLVNMAEAAGRLGRADEQLACLERAVALNDSLCEAHFNLGLAYDALGELRPALAAFKRAVELRPSQAQLRHRLAKAHRDCGELDEAIACLRALLQADPQNALALSNLGTALFYVGQHDEALAALRAALALEPGRADTRSNLIYQLAFHPASDEQQILAEAREFARIHETRARLTREVDPARFDAERRLRVGYLSPDFREHVMAHVVLPLFEHRDRSAFELRCYSSVKVPDRLTERFRDLADAFVDVSRSSDDEAAELIARDEVDILVDLTMHMAEGRMLVCARRPAPVQLCWFAYPGTTGLTCLDYRITDPFLDPPERDDAVYSETSLRLPDTFWCWDPLTSAPEPGPLPALAKGTVTFGCLNNFCKLNQGVLELWAKVLNALPGSTLLIMAPRGEAGARVLTRLAALGIAEARVELVDYRPRLDYLALYRRIDICLDTLPYNGHTTSLDAFWMGVPVVTLVGQTLVGRAGLCQAMNLGLPELVAHDPRQFIANALELALDLPRLAALRDGLRGRFTASPLMDGSRFARNFEAAYRAAWRACCERSTLSKIHHDSSGSA